MTEEQVANVRCWIEALRSGEYRQGQEWLRYGDNFCCLGVLCEKAGVESRKLVSSSTLYDFSFGGDFIADSPPVGWFTYTTGFEGDLQARLITMNDEEEADFKTIANFIEKKLEVALANA